MSQNRSRFNPSKCDMPVWRHTIRSGYFKNDLTSNWLLVAAGMVLRGDQYQAWTLWRRLSLRCPAKGLQNSDDGCISGTDTEAHGREYGDAENYEHEERIHNQPPLNKR
jgi:hypothetical protein